MNLLYQKVKNDFLLYFVVMALYFITGAAGTGKTTICRALKQRGFTTYDVDEDGFAKWTNIETGYVHPKSSVKKEQRTPDFLEAHSWNVQKKDIEKLAIKAKDSDVFLCGSISNEQELLSLFDKKFTLYVDANILRKRLALRTGDNWGSQIHEIDETLNSYDELNRNYVKLGFIFIDATQSSDAMINQIISEI